MAQKLARWLGTPNIDNAARVCHAPSTAALKDALGVGATTVSYGDVIGSDLVVLFGSHVANAQPVFMKYLYLARKRSDTKVAVVNPLREPALERYWVPSHVESAMFGTRMTDEFFGVHTGGDVAFINGVLKLMIERELIDRSFIDQPRRGLRRSWPRSWSGSRSSSSNASAAPRAATCSASRRCTRARRAPCSYGRWASPST